MLRKGGKTEKRLKKYLWRWKQPAWANNQGIWLPCKHPAIAPGIARQIYFGEYESKEVDIVANKLSTDDIVVEVGAGIGYLSSFCAKRIGSERVSTYEANPALMPIIQAVHQRNNISPAVHNVMLANGSGECTFYIEPEFWASSTSVRSQNAQAIQIPQRDLNIELKQKKPTFLIIDIEGGEGDFFAYANLTGVKKICLETHPDVLGNDGITSVFSALLGQGFVIDFSCIRKNVFFFYRPN